MSVSLLSPTRPTSVLVVRTLEVHEDYLVQDVFEAMGADSRFLRFHGAVTRLSHPARRELATTVPGDRVSVVALRHGRAVGMGQWVRDEQDPTLADLAVAVADRHQGGGVGRELAAALAASADRAGVDWFRADVLGTNRLVRAWVQGLGPHVREERPGELRILVRAVGERTTTLPPRPAA